MERFEVSYWDAFVETLFSDGYVVFLVVVSCILLVVLISILVTGLKDKWKFSSIAEGSGWALGVAVFVSAIVLAMTSVVNGSNSFYANIDQAVIDKYDLDLFEQSRFDEQDNGAIHIRAKIASYEHGVSKGYGSYESRSEKGKDLVSIVIGTDGVPYIMPWDGVDKDFVESMER